MLINYTSTVQVFVFLKLFKLKPMQFDYPFLLDFCVMEYKLEFFEFPNFERTGLCDIKKLLQIYNLYI